MAEEQGMSMDQLEFMKRMKAIASDLWGGNSAPEEAAPAKKPREEAGPKAAPKPAIGINNLWKTADETIDWTDALAHNTPTDGLTSPKLWSFYHKNAAKVLEGDLDAYTEVLQRSNPLGELTDFAEGINMRAVSADRLESTFTCKESSMGKNKKQYLSAMGLRIARDLLACLPVSEVAVTGEMDGETVFSVTYTRQQLLHRNFVFIDPVALSEECGAVYY